MSVFKNHKGKIILIISILLTYPMFLKLNFVNFPHIYASIFAAFILSYIVSDVIIRSIVELVNSETVLYSKQSLDESDMIILWNQVNNNNSVRIDLNQQTFIISIRTQESNHDMCGVYFYLLDADGVFHKDNTSETFDFMQFSEFIDYESFMTIIRRKYNKLLLKGKAIYGDIES